MSATLSLRALRAALRIVAAAVPVLGVARVSAPLSAQAQTADTAPSRAVKRPRLPVTPALEADAFASDDARALLALARASRLRTDSGLVAYDATTYSRLSVGFSARSVGRNRLAMRSETATRVRWQRGTGAQVDITGSRAAVPMADGADAEANVMLPSVPYFPGREALWMGAGVAKAEVDPDQVVHPLAAGSEAYYRYALGDSLALEIGGGRRLRLRELRVQPRRPEWRLVVGTFWFDASSGQLVRAAYRFSTPMDIRAMLREQDSTAMDDVPLAARPLVFPLRATLDGVTIEYGLFGGAWLPRTQTLLASAQVSLMRLPITFEERYRYASVNVRDTTLVPVDTTGAERGSGVVGVSLRSGAAEDEPEVDVDSLVAARPVLSADSARRLLPSVPSPDSLTAAAAAAKAAGDTAAARRLRGDAADARTRRRELRDAIACGETGMRERVTTSYGGALPMRTRIPCDPKALAQSAALPPSIFSPNEDLLGADARDALLADLGFGLQAGFGPRRPTIEFALADGALRYNRVEGVSVGAAVAQELGAGFRWRVDGRIGLADRAPLGELALTRTTGRRSLTARAYRRLAVATDLGQPLAFGASFQALLAGVDDGMYFRAWGGEVEWRTEPDGATALRLFAERQGDAPVRTRWSLLGGQVSSLAGANVVARAGTWAGVVLGDRRSIGQDPQGWRLFTDARAEAATGASEYVRAFGLGTVSRGLGRRGLAAVTLAAGTTAGDVPAQRRFFLGGADAVRGQYTGRGAGLEGTATWFVRSELAAGPAAFRRSLFYDVGWAGDRARIGRSPGPLVRGVGLAASFLDGFVRTEVARGLAPVPQWRVALLIEARL